MLRQVINSSRLVRRTVATVGHGRNSSSSVVPAFATIDPWKVSGAEPHTVCNLLKGTWTKAAGTEVMPDPLNGEPFLLISDTKKAELPAFIESLNSCKKSGLHNPFKNPERYLLYGASTARAAALLATPAVEDFFVKLIQRVAPKSDFQARGEVKVTQKFLENFGGDQVRFLARSFAVPGDHAGQMSSGHRWPYGPVTIIAPFNFPLEIPILQLMGALFMGNKVTLKCCSRVSVVMEQALRMLHACGVPTTDVDFINCDGETMHSLLLTAKPRMTQFTGSSKIAEIIARDLHGRIKLEDAGFDWKILGPDVSDERFVEYTCDQDAYAYSGQKCSAQSALFAHENWVKAGFLDRIKELAAKRSMKNDFTSGPVLTVTNETFFKHVEAMKKVPGAKLLFGGGLIEGGEKIPARYGSFEPTAIQVPIEEFVKDEYFELCTTEIFGPYQVVASFGDADVDTLLTILEKMDHHLTAAIVSKDHDFTQKVIANTVNGTTYCGIRARTTGAPQNHWFGPAGDPRGAGIGSIEAIRYVWSCHREIVTDVASIPSTWVQPKTS